MSYKRLLTLAIVTMASVVACQAQYVLRNADAEYQLFNYKKAVGLYEQAYMKKNSLHAAERIAECYALVGDYRQTESWAAIAAGMPGATPNHVLAYAKALQQNSKYAEAKVQYQKYGLLTKGGESTRLAQWILGCDSAVRWMKSPTAVDIRNEIKLNSPKSDWGAFPYGKEIAFASDRGMAVDGQFVHRPFLKFDGTNVPKSNLYGWTGNAYLRIYLAKDGIDSVSKFPIDAGTIYHIGPASFTADGKEMYFALTKIPKKPVYADDKIATVNIEIYASRKDASGKWTAPVAFKYNSPNAYSVGDPFISPDGKSLYFASDMPGGVGGTDIYVSKRTVTGEWAAPVGLKALNTTGDERTPYLDSNGDLYFSSDGWPGMGGLDIFVMMASAGKGSTVRNLGYPLNSPQDDFAYVKNSATEGYLSSNRQGGMGSEDIYHFSEQGMLAFSLSGTLRDKATNHPLENAVVTLAGPGGQLLKQQTNKSGEFAFRLDQNSVYALSGEKTGFRRDLAELSTVGLAKSSELKKDLYLERIAIDSAIRLENIYYDFDKSDIRPDAAIELDKLVRIMKDNPTIWIELGSHTDSRGNDHYNQLLSQRRADAAVRYIISRGIDANRIVAKGYGESRLLNGCSNGVKCTPAEHQLNRRTEFKIIKQ